MSDRDSLPPLTTSPVHAPFGRTVDSRTPRFPGKQTKSLGFGLDLLPEIALAFHATLLLRPPRPLFFDRSRFRQSAVRQHYRLVTYRHLENSGHSTVTDGLPEVYRRLHALRSERVYDRLSFEDVKHYPQYPERVFAPALPTVVTWRHAQFVQLVVGDRLCHLRTTEMANPPAVRQRIHELFRIYYAGLHRRSFHLLDEVEQQTAFNDLAFALYEQVLKLRSEAANRLPAYLSAIERRVHDGTPQAEIILRLEPSIDDGLASTRLAVRRQRYLDTLTYLQDQSVCDLWTNVLPTPDA